MNKKRLSAEKKNEECYSQIPDWYWKYGLHDAAILSVSELQLAPDHKEKPLKYNCLEIESARGSRENFIVEFEIPEIERK